MPLDDNDRAQINKYRARLATVMEEAQKWSDRIKGVYEAAEEPVPPEYESIKTAASGSPRRIYARSEFTGQAPSVAVKKILEDHGALSIDEIYEQMVAGGFAFTEQSPEKAKASLRIVIGKSSNFIKTTSGFYAIYDGPTRRPRNKGGQNGDNDGTADAGDSAQQDTNEADDAKGTAAAK